MTSEQLAALLAVIPARHGVFFRLLASTGLRISEAIALQWRHLDLDSPSPHVKVRRGVVRGSLGPPKSRYSRREVPLDDALVKALRKLQEETEWPGEEDLVFTAGNGAYLHVGNLRRRVLKPAREEADLEWVGFHTFRHTCASLLFAERAQRCTGPALARASLRRVHAQPLRPPARRGHRAAAEARAGCRRSAEIRRTRPVLWRLMPDLPAAPSADALGLRPRATRSSLRTSRARIRSAQARAARAINAELIDVYWQIGHEILRRQAEEGNRRGRGGPKIVERLSADLRSAFPGARGFSVRSLRYMRAFAAAWPEREMLQSGIAALPWAHVTLLLDKLSDRPTRDWYAARASSWSQAELAHHIASRLHERQAAAITNFERTLPEAATPRLCSGSPAIPWSLTSCSWPRARRSATWKWRC